ncbi:MAG TPA: hypothetical protein VK464_18860 [Symbiobacteriaceae bacterium]|nr:hypothetical protein [Symbiobacteriaceae bacterium]
MNDERVQILRMVQEGKVSPEEAAKLLDALEQPDAKQGARQKARYVRIVIVDGNRTQTIAVSAAVAKWLLQLPGGLIVQTPGGLTPEVLADAIANGSLGKVFEAENGDQRVEVWLEA